MRTRCLHPVSGKEHVNEHCRIDVDGKVDTCSRGHGNHIDNCIISEITDSKSMSYAMGDSDEADDIQIEEACPQNTANRKTYAGYTGSNQKQGCKKSSDKTGY